MKEHTTHYACDCVLNRLEDLEDRLCEAINSLESAFSHHMDNPAYWIRNARELLDDKLKGVHDGNVRSTRPARSKTKMWVSSTVPAPHRTRGGKKSWK